MENRMTNKIIFLGIGLAIIAAFALGRYTATSTTTTKTDTKTDEQKNTDTTQHETITEKKSPDGSITIVTTIDTAKKTTDHKDSQTDTQSTTTKGQMKLNLSALVATSIHTPGIPLYGISVSKEFIGPLTLGAFGLTNGTVGISIGMNF